MAEQLANPSCYLKNLDIYEDVPEAQLVRIANTACDTLYEKGDFIYTPQTELTHIFVITSGEVILHHDRDGKKHVFDVLSPGSIFGQLQGLDMHPTHTAEATRRTTICATPVKEFLETVREYPEIMLRFMKKMSNRIADYEYKIELTQAPARERILRELQRLERKRNENFLNKAHAKPLRVTHEELASLTGLNRVTVTRVMSELRRDGAIAIDKNTGTVEVQKDSLLSI